MVKYIPLDALLAWAKKTYLCENASAIRKICYKQLVEHLNVLEVKEVDLDFTKEVDVYIRDNGDTNGFFNVEELAKHFFELGMKTSNSLTWKDIKLIWNITDEMDNMPEEEFYKEVLKRFKEQKGENT